MYRSIALTVLVLLPCIGSVSAEPMPSWLCVGDQTTGFSFERGSWNSGQFKPEKYVLKVNTSADIDRCLEEGTELGKCPERTGYEFIKFGKDSGHACRNNNSETIVCGNPFTKIVFHKKTLRFINIYEAGYVSGDDPGNTPSIEIGRCTPL